MRARTHRRPRRGDGWLGRSVLSAALVAVVPGIASAQTVGAGLWSTDIQFGARAIMPAQVQAQYPFPILPLPDRRPDPPEILRSGSPKRSMRCWLSRGTDRQRRDREQRGAAKTYGVRQFVDRAVRIGGPGFAPVFGAPVFGAIAGGAPSFGASVFGASIRGTPVVGARIGGTSVGRSPVGRAPFARGADARVVGASGASASVVGAPLVDTPAVSAPVAGAPPVGTAAVATPAVSAPVAGAPTVGADKRAGH